MTNPKPPLGNIQNAMELGKMVASQRKAQGLTQSDLAGLAQTGTRFISDLENGKGTVQFDKVMHILKLLGLDVVIMDRQS
jgi:y4mF family transcriptional regulator